MLLYPLLHHLLCLQDRMIILLLNIVVKSSCVNNLLIPQIMPTNKNTQNKAKTAILSLPLDNSLNLSIMGDIGKIKGLNTAYRKHKNNIRPV